MLIYNTTYHVEEGEDKNFLIWMQEHYLPEVEKNGTLYACLLYTSDAADE